MFPSRVFRPAAGARLLALFAPLAAFGCQVLADVDADLLPTGATGATSATSGTAGGQGGTGGQGGQGGQGGGSGGTGGAVGGGGPGGGGAGGAGGGNEGCEGPADCPPPSAVCKSATCTAGVCGEVNTAAGKPAAVQVLGDCQQTLCDGSGAPYQAVVFNDPFDDGLECTLDYCDQDVAQNDPLQAGIPCSQDGGVKCDGAGSCVQCTSAADCVGTGCSPAGQCVASCDDGLKDGTESDVDCGGSCAACPDGAGCAAPSDCQNGTCNANVCVGPTCVDGIQNGSETGSDCGGGSCPGCAPGLGCALGADCAEGVCKLGACAAPTCLDGVSNGNETGTDCGGAGSGCPACPDASPCAGNGDCLGGICTQGLCCTVPHDCSGQCGALVGTCGLPVDCGGCSLPETCGGGGLPNLCGCTVDPAALTCAGKTCGDVPNNCGYTTDCGTCQGGLSCGLGAPPEANRCGCTPPCGSPLWEATYGDESSQRVTAVARAANGDTVVVGAFDGTLTLGGTTLTSAGASDVFVARFSPTGVVLWAARYGDALTQTANAVAVDANGDVVVMGDFDGTLDFGGGTLTAVGGIDVFVLKLGSLGQYQWSKRAGDASPQRTGGVAVDPSGNICLVGTFLGSVNWGGQSVPTTGLDDVFVAKLDPAGLHLFSKGLGGGATALQRGLGAAAGADGSCIAVGRFAATMDLGAGTVTGPGGDEAFVVKLDAAGVPVWSRVWGDATNQVAYAAAVDPGGDVYVTGASEGSVDFGTGSLAAQGLGDTFVVRLSGATGASVWASLFGGPNVQTGRSLAVTSAGELLIAGDFGGTLDLSGNGTNVLVSAGSNDVFLGKLTGAGALVWAQRYGNVALQTLGGVAVDASGNVAIGGAFQGAIDFGNGAFLSAGADDAFVATRSP